MNEYIKKALNNTLTYSGYRKLVKDLIKDKSSTSGGKDEYMLNYSILNDKRMDRLDKKAILDDETAKNIQLAGKQTWLVLTEGWCGDAAQNIPYLNKLAQENPNIELKLVLRDQNNELMNDFLTNGGQAIPKLISLDENNNVLFSWGPRPTNAAKLISDYKAEHGVVDAQIKKDLQIWYNKNKGADVYSDLVELTSVKAES